MNILLAAVNAKYIHSNLAVYSLQAYAKKQGKHVNIKEYTINQQIDEILQDLYLSSPDLLFFSCYIWNIEYVKELVGELHKIAPQVPIWLGGPEVSFRCEEFLQENPGVTGIMMGEGELSFSKVCGYYDREGNLEDIDGIIWRKFNGEILNQSLKQMLAMDEIPFAYQNLEEFENRIIYYESSRGCPFSCSYCLSSIDKQLRFRSLPLVYEELQFFIDHRVPQVKFVDRTFNCVHEHAIGIWKYIKEHDNGVTNFHFEISADLLNEEEFELLASMRPGLVQLEIGVQTTNFETIREIKRSMSVGKVEDAVLRVKAGGNIHQHLDLIAGLPYEDYESFKSSFNEIYELKSQQLQLGFLKVLKGSYMYEQAEEYGLIYREKPPYEVLETRWLSYGEIFHIKLVEEMLEVHYNSGQFLTALQVLEQKYRNAFEMYLRLGFFYGQRGYLNQKHARMRRYEIFLEFASAVDPDNIELYKEALTYDFYLRENAKKRPTWAPELTEYKKQMGAYLREQGIEQKYCHIEPFAFPVYEKKETTATAMPWELNEQSPWGEPAGVSMPGTGVSKAAGIWKKTKEPVWLLFDYDARDPQSKEAAVSVIELPENL